MTREEHWGTSERFLKGKWFCVKQSLQLLHSFYQVAWPRETPEVLTADRKSLVRHAVALPQLFVVMAGKWKILRCSVDAFCKTAFLQICIICRFGSSWIFQSSDGKKALQALREKSFLQFPKSDALMPFKAFWRKYSGTFWGKPGVTFFCLQISFQSLQRLQEDKCNLCGLQKALQSTTLVTFGWLKSAKTMDLVIHGFWYL